MQNSEIVLAKLIKWLDEQEDRYMHTGEVISRISIIQAELIIQEADAKKETANPATELPFQ